MQFNITSKICPAFLCLLLSSSAVGLPQICGANFFMKEIKLSSKHGQFVTKVDDEDFERLSKYKWFAHFRRGNWYAARSDHWTEAKGIYKSKTISMHRELMGVTNPKTIIDHKDRDSLNNQKANLRTCDDSQNRINSKKRDNTSSKHKGVSWDKNNNKWLSSVSLNGVRHHIGSFESEILAALAYNQKASELHGEFVTLNKI